MNDSDSDSSIDTEVRCISCQKMFFPHDDGLCMECHYRVIEAENKVSEEINVLKAKADFLRLSPSLDHSSNSRSFTDVFLIASDGAAPPIPAHKAVLVSRSPVFKAMLENKMEETRISTIIISEVSYDTLRTFVNYLYTADQACFDEQMAFDLLVLSDKYQVKQLKSCCEMFLVTNLSVETNLMAYVFAHKYNAKSLLDAALSDIIENMEAVTKREDYVKMVKHDPHLIIKIYEAYLSKQVARTSKGKTS